MSAQVAFHFNAPDKLAYACRFVRKALRAEVGVAIVAPEDVLHTLDRMLWNMAPHDFVAHCRADADADVLAASPAVLAVDAHSAPVRAVLLQLHAEVPAGVERFAKVVEVVSATDEHDRSQARLRWRHYAAQGHAIQRHDLVNRSEA